MKKSVSLAIAMAVATVCMSASAGVVTFEGFAPGIYTSGDVLSDPAQPAQQLTVGGQNGFDGAVIDGTDPDSCAIAVCPVGSMYYAGLNDGSVSFSFSGNTFNLSGVDFGFLLPAPASINFAVGQLIVTANDGSTVSRDFPLQDATTGLYGFTHWDFDGAFRQSRFTQVTFSACLYDGSGACVNPATNQAQFALDNIAFVPEPGSLPLVALSLAAMLAACRRRAA